MSDIIIDMIGGNCPVQAEGTIDGKRFYFRARHEHWSLEICSTATSHYLEWPIFDERWEYHEEWGDGPFDAGWMPKDVAREMIAKGAVLYRQRSEHAA